MYKLVPLRIPEGWRVIHNDFKEYYPAKKVILTDEKHTLSEDMLILAHDMLGHPGYVPALKVDLGWCRRKDSTGFFIVSFFMDEKMLHRADVQSISEATEQIEKWVSWDFIKTYLQDYNIPRI